MRWKTKDMFYLLSSIGSVWTDHPGGDYDTEAIIINPVDDIEFRVCGFNPSNVKRGEPDDCEIQFIEVNDHLDSKGGCNNPKAMVYYGQILEKLKQFDVPVVEQMKNYL